MVEVGGDSALCLPEKRRSVLPSPPGAMWNPSLGLPFHGPLQQRWPAVGEAHDNGTRAASEVGEAQAAKSVGDELEAPKAGGFAEGKAIAWGTLAFDNGDKR
jgi:hypothetical protein